MRKILIISVTLIVIILFLLSKCTKEDKTKNLVKQSQIKGYWLQVEANSDGKITDLTNNKYAYLEITDNRLFFYVYYSDTETYGVSEKYYKLEEEKIYYDYYELKGNDWKEKMDEAYSGVFYPTIDKENKLILTEYDNDTNKDDGYEINTYKKIDAKDLPFEK